ncbi:MAG: hypothetical protein IJY36_06425 [Coprobacter sp.]|nr:hypothetical protein [Coprobacter sp.]
MKNLIIMPIFSVLLIACGNKYSDALETYLTEDDGVKIELNFKLLDEKFVKDITAEDSLQLCKDGRIAVKESWIDDYKEDMIYYKKRMNKSYKDLKHHQTYFEQKWGNYEMNKNAYKDMEYLVDKDWVKYYKKDYEGDKEQYEYYKKRYEEYLNDTYETVYDDGIKKYSQMTPNQVIAKVVECKYSIINPLTKLTQEVTRKFIFSADGKICHGEYKEKK